MNISELLCCCCCVSFFIFIVLLRIYWLKQLGSIVFRNSEARLENENYAIRNESPRLIFFPLLFQAPIRAINGAAVETLAQVKATRLVLFQFSIRDFYQNRRKKSSWKSFTEVPNEALEMEVIL